MATPNISVNYDDKRFTDVEADKQAALNEVDATYGGMVNNTDAFYQKQIDAANDYADKQAQLQQERTDFAIEQINQQKEQTTKDYQREQSGAYVDWQKQSNEFGVQAEQMAAQGMNNTGFSESSQVSMWNTYQNRVATARESYNRAILNYDNAIKDAQLQNNAALAEIAYNALQTQLELSLEGFQYKNTLVLAQSDKKMEVDNNYYSRYQDVLNQINHENAMAEEIRQYNERLAEEKRQYNSNYALQQAELAEKKRQYDLENGSGLVIGGGDGNGIDYTADDTTPPINKESTVGTGRGADNPNYSKNRPVPLDIEQMNQMGLSTWSGEQLAEAISLGYLEKYVEDGKTRFRWTGKRSKDVMSRESIITPIVNAGSKVVNGAKAVYNAYKEDFFT